MIDTDALHDDIEALSLALQNPDLDLVAITTVAGSVSVHQAVANVARTLRANNMAGKVKISMYIISTFYMISKNMPPQ